MLRPVRMPRRLAVWDSRVAMIVGDGAMIEAGPYRPLIDCH